MSLVKTCKIEIKVFASSSKGRGCAPTSDDHHDHHPNFVDCDRLELTGEGIGSGFGGNHPTKPRPLFTQIRVGGSQGILSYQSRKWKGKWEAKKRR